MTMYLLSLTIGVSIGDIERSYANLRHSLQGVIDSQQVDNMVKIGINLLHKPTRQSVSIMFVDIVEGNPPVLNMDSPNFLKFIYTPFLISILV